MSNKRITIRDVAEHAGVSISTVSRVFNGLDRVKPETYKKVMRAIEELNYTPNKVAVSMVKNETKTIVIIVPSTINEFYTAVIQGVELTARKHGYLPFICCTNDDAQTEKDFIDDLLSKNVDGFILVPCQNDTAFYKSIPKPVVFVDRQCEEGEIHSVVVDNVGGSYRAVKHLLDNGHRKIAIINGPHDTNGKERYWGYEQALRDFAISVNPDYIKTGDWFEENGYRSTNELLSLEDPPTAIFATNNLICQGVLKAFRDLNLRVGEDISLVGFDDHELARFLLPSISVVDRPTIEMGTSAAEILFKIMKNKDDDRPQKVVLGTRFISRGSVKRLQA